MPTFSYGGAFSSTTDPFVPWSTTVENVKPIDLLDIPIIWSQQIPPFLSGKTFRDILGLTNSITNVILQLTINGTASRATLASFSPTFIIRSYSNVIGNYVESTITIGTPGFEYLPSSGLDAKLSNVTLTYNLGNGFFPILNIGVTDVHSDDRSIQGILGTFAFTANFSCSGDQLSNDICLDSCKNTLSPGSSLGEAYCLPDMLHYFQVATDQGRAAPISFLNDYVTRYKSNGDIDNTLFSYCSNTYHNFYDLNTIGPGIKYGSLDDVDVCGCHLEHELYRQFLVELSQRIDGLTSLGLDERCMVSACASSVFKTTDMYEQGNDKVTRCDQLQCINILEFNNDGTFDRSSIKINQSNECNKLTDKDNPTNNRGNGSNNWIWILIGGILLIVIILIIILLVPSGKKKS